MHLCSGLFWGTGLRHLSGLKALQSLDLAECYDFYDTGLQYLSALTALTRLNLICCDISAASLRHLSGLSLLQCLRLDVDTLGGILNRSGEFPNLP